MPTALIMDQELHMLQDAEAVQVAALVCTIFDVPVNHITMLSFCIPTSSLAR